MNREIILRLRVTEVERSLLHTIASREGTSMSEIARQAVRAFGKSKGIPPWEWVGLPESREFSEVKNVAE